MASENELDNLHKRMWSALAAARNWCNDTWYWNFDDVPAWEDPAGKKIICHGPSSEYKDLTIINMHRYLWFSFDSRADAMLVRMAVIGLQSEHHAIGGRMS